MKLTCLSCLHEYEGSIFRDEMGWHGVCPDCGASFHVELPAGSIVMVFADDSDPDKENENLTDDFDNTASIRTYYVFNSAAEFAVAWREMVEHSDGMWYFVLCDGELYISGACGTHDEDCFEANMEGWPYE